MLQDACQRKLLSMEGGALGKAPRTTHATKAGIRYRYYVSRPCLHGETKTTEIGSVTRVPAADIEDVVVKSVFWSSVSLSGEMIGSRITLSPLLRLIGRIAASSSCTVLLTSLARLCERYKIDA
jgi:hypothetical protein